MVVHKFLVDSAFIIAIILCSNHGFNIDTTIPVIKRGAPGSYFGFSVSEHQVVNSATNAIDEHLLLIGAPKANVSGLEVPSTGDVFKCDARSTNEQDCERIPGPAEADDEFDAFDVIAATTSDGRKDQWLGNVVFSQGTGQQVVICGHRYRKKEREDHYMVGKCLLMEQQLIDRMLFVSPCSGKDLSSSIKDKANNYGMCQAGTSGMLTKDTVLMIGAPGSIIWTGQIYQQSKAKGLGLKIRYETDAELFNKFTPVLPGSYLGYSLTAGKFDKEKKWQYVAGAPKSNLNGSVVVFNVQMLRSSTMTFDPNNIMTGDQEFSSFGHSLLAVDVNNDGYDDLIVSSPLYFEKNVGGAIFIYMGGRNITGFPKDSKKVKIVSREMTDDECERLECEHARFGFSLAKIGDVNKDGFEDVAVSAPFEGNGAIYIFHGSDKGLVQVFAQRITAEDMPTPSPVHTFGYSLSGGIDLDGNGYPDILTGAYSSDTAFLLRTRPIIHIQSEIRLTPEKIDYKPDKIVICPWHNVLSQCVQIEICLKFTAEPVERFTTRQNIVYRIDVEPDEISKRMEFKDPKDDTHSYVERKVTLYRQSSNRPLCTTEVAYLKENIQDLLSAVEFTASYSLEDSAVPAPPQPGMLADINDYPILILDGQKQSVAFQVEFQKNCGDNDVCESNLFLTVENNLPKDEDGFGQLKRGMHSLIILDVTIKNTAEPAYATHFYLTIPAGLRWENVESVKPEGKQYDCRLQLDTLLVCQNIGNPLTNRTEIHFKHTLEIDELKASDNKFVLTASVNTTSLEKTPEDIVEMIFRVVTVADVYLHSKSEPAYIIYHGDVNSESAVKYDTQIGPAVNHTYLIMNRGPGDVDNLRLTIFWPYEMESDYPHGKHLLYLMEPPWVQGAATCFLDPDIYNVLDVEEGPVYTAANNTTYKRRRKKREAAEKANLKIGESQKSDSTVVIDCEKGNARCHRIHCDISLLTAWEYAVITIAGRLWKSTLSQDFRGVKAVEIYSRAVIVVDPTLYIQNSTADDTADAKTTAYPSIEVVEQEGIAWWIILISAVAGILLQMLLTSLLWKLGFFRRKKRNEIKTYYKNMEARRKRERL